MTLKELRNLIDKTIADGTNPDMPVVIEVTVDDLDYTANLDGGTLSVMDSDGDCFDYEDVDLEEMEDAVAVFRLW